MLVDRGDAYYNIKGSSPQEVLASLLKVMRMPKAIDRAALQEALLEREHLMPTAIGDGFAIPHPRYPLAPDEESALVAVCYLDAPVEWGALDNKPVSTLFLVLSSDVQSHLAVLSSIAYLARQKDFRIFVAKRPLKGELLEFMRSRGL